MPAAKGNKYAAGNKGGGLPTLYKSNYPARAKKAMRAGFTLVELAEMFGVSEQSIHAWKNKHEEFALALSYGRKEADAEIVNSLYHRAKGYKHEAVKIFQYEGQIIEAPYTEHYAPDTNAAIFWLKNRDPDKWRDKPAEEEGDKKGDTHYHVHVVIPPPAPGEDRSYRNAKSRPSLLIEQPPARDTDSGETS